MSEDYQNFNDEGTVALLPMDKTDKIDKKYTTNSKLLKVKVTGGAWNSVGLKGDIRFSLISDKQIVSSIDLNLKKFKLPEDVKYAYDSKSNFIEHGLLPSTLTFAFEIDEASELSLAIFDKNNLDEEYLSLDLSTHFGKVRKSLQNELELAPGTYPSVERIWRTVPFTTPKKMKSRMGEFVEKEYVEKFKKYAVNENGWLDIELEYKSQYTEKQYPISFEESIFEVQEKSEDPNAPTKLHLHYPEKRCCNCERPMLRYSYWFGKPKEGQDLRLDHHFCKICKNDLPPEQLPLILSMEPNYLSCTECNIDIILEYYGDDSENLMEHVKTLKCFDCMKHKSKISIFDEMKYVALFFKNLVVKKRKNLGPYNARDLFRHISPAIFAEAFDLYLFGNTKDLFDFAVDAMQIVTLRTENDETAPWVTAKQDMEKKINKLMSQMPVIEEVGQTYYDEVMYMFYSNREKIVQTELNVFPNQDSIFAAVELYWKRNIVDLSPIPMWTNTSVYFFIQFIFFALFMGILTYHAYSYRSSLPQESIYFKTFINDKVGGAKEAITSNDLLWQWITDLRGEWSQLDPKFLVFSDKILVRQIRSRPENCDSIIYKNYSESFCAPRQDPYRIHQTDPIYKNTTLGFYGHKTVLSFLQNGIYTDLSYGVRLPFEENEFNEKIDELKNIQWIDEFTQAVIIEFAVYGLTSKTAGTGLVLVEFGDFSLEIHGDTFVLSETFFNGGYSWSAIYLIICCVGFIIQELRDAFLMYVFSSLNDQLKANSLPSALRFFYYYVSPWNVIDIGLLVCVMFYVIEQYNSTLYLDSYTIENIWYVAYKKGAAEAAGALALIFAYIRVLHFLTPLEFIGILITTIFQMLYQIVRFILVLIIIIIGYAAAFHIVYESNDMYTNFVKSTLSVFLATPSGYQIPDAYPDGVLFLPGPIVGIICQVSYVFVTVIVLINLLVALMSDAYNDRTKVAVELYRWDITTIPYYETFNTLYPAPLNVLHLFLLPLSICTRCCGRIVEEDILKKPNKKLMERLFRNMVRNYMAMKDAEEEEE